MSRLPSHRRVPTQTAFLALGIALSSASCSAIVAPDLRRLGPEAEVDAAVPPVTDAFVPLGVDAPITAIDTGPVTTRIAPSNVEAPLLDLGTRDLVIETAASFDTTACMASSAEARVLRQRDGSEVCALLVRNARITEGGALRVFGQRALVVLASGDVEIAGTLDVSARGPERGPGGGLGGTPATPSGSGGAPGIGGETNGIYADGGGGGGGLCSPGGRGGRGGTASGGNRLDALPSVLEPLLGGGGGGLGPGGRRPLPDGNAGLGGGGGGAVQITARGTLRVRGRILAGGGAGGGGQPDERFVNWGAGGGGGGGGGILLEATTLRIEDGASLLASGGSGGAGSSMGVPVSSGTDGREALMPRPGGTGGGMYGASGGASGAGATPAGADGAANTNDGANGGGGGGGAGCVVLRAVGGATRPSGATLSPSTTGLSLLPAHTR